jgi:hypothetical protein
MIMLTLSWAPLLANESDKRPRAARHSKGMWLSPQQTCAGSTMTLTLALAIGLQVIFEHVMMDPVLWFIIKWIFFVTESVLLLRHITTRS